MDSLKITLNKEENYQEKDKAFNRLKGLQALLKKEASLRELFTKTSEETKKNIEEQCRDIYQKKLDVFFTLKRFNKSEQSGKKFELIENNSEHLKDLNNYLPKLLTYLWEDPKLMSNLLMNSNIDDIKKTMAHFITNNFYENILSFNYLQENFMYVLSILLKKEISELKSTDDLNNFLENTPCGCLLEQLKCSDKKMYFFVSDIEKLIEERKRRNQKEKGNKKKEDDEDDIYKKDWNDTPEIDINNYFSRTSTLIEENSNDEAVIKNLFGKESSKVFSEKYSPELKIKDFLEKINTSEDKKFKDYLNLQLKYCKNQDNYFSNQTFMNKVFNSNYSTKLLNEYQLNFMKVIIIIKDIFNKLLSDLHLLPYSIKCICKIILLLIRKKFPQIIACEENAFVAKFFFCKLFAPIFCVPSTGALINNFIISNITLYNLGNMIQFILQLVSGRLYREGGSHGDFTPLNWFFMEEMPLVFTFFENLTRVELPKFIDDYINDKLPEDYVYNYFKENPEEYIFHRSICFNIYDIKCIIDSMQKNKDKIFQGKENNGIYKTFEKLCNKKNYAFLNDLVEKQDKVLELEEENKDDSLNYSTSISNNIKEEQLNNKKNEIDKNKNVKTGLFGFIRKKKEKVEETQPQDVIKYYLISNLLINDKYKNIFNSNIKTYHFSIKELKECKNEEEILANKIIKIKNFFSSLLCNYRQLVKTDFDEGTTDKIIDILKELRSFMKSSNFVIDGNIPSEWYVSSLIQYLKKLPENLADNEYELFFKEMENDLFNNLKQLDFEKLSICLNKTKFAQKGILFYQDAKQILIDILLNKKVIKIVEKDKINVELSFNYSEKKKKFRIKPLGVKEKQIYLLGNMDYNKKGSERVCTTIKDFCKHFPNLVRLNSKICLASDVFDLQLQFDIPGQLQIYFENVNNYLTKIKKLSDNNSLILINQKIYDYVMGKIYNKIFPNEQSNEDCKILENCLRLAWTEPKHFILGKKNYVYDSFLPDAIKNFDLLYSEKSPRKKILCMTNIFDSISNLVKFNNDGNAQIGVDDQMPILNYTLIKAQPKWIFSICKFMEIYLGDLKKKKEDNQLMQLRGVCENMIIVNNESLNDVTEEEFIRKSEESLRESVNTSRRNSLKDLKG